MAKEPTRSLRRVRFAAVIMLIGGPTAASAQSFDVEPIFLDIGPANAALDQAATAPLLVAAFEPSDEAPRFAPSADDVGGVQLAALEVAAGLPLPSIIVGRIEPGDEARFGIASMLPATLAAFGFEYDDLEARAAMRESDPEMFRALVEGGHLDPPEDLLVRALQTEMSRMNCYRSSIDGQWGRGSRGSVSEYFAKLEGDVTWPDQNPSAELFRAIMLNGDVTCDTPVATRPRSTSSGSSGNRNTTTRSTPRSAPAPQAPATPAPAAPPRIVVR